MKNITKNDTGNLSSNAIIRKNAENEEEEDFLYHFKDIVISEVLKEFESKIDSMKKGY
jgi:hypothetical protein